MRSCMASGTTNLITEKVLDTPMRMLVRKYPDLAETVLDKCYKEKQIEQNISVEMNFEFIEDSFNYQQKKTEESSWLNMFMSGNSSGYEHFTKAFHAKSDEGFEDPYTSDHELVIRNHPIMVMAEHSQRVRNLICIIFILICFFHIRIFYAILFA